MHGGSYPVTRGAIHPDLIQWGFRGRQVSAALPQSRVG